MTNDTFSNPWIPIRRCRSYGADRMFQPVTIKILLLRSMPGPTNVQTPVPGLKAWAIGLRPLRGLDAGFGRCPFYEQALVITFATTSS